MFEPQKFGEFLRNKRLLSGKSARDVASEIKVTATYLWLLEKGWINSDRKPPQPSVDIVNSLIETLGLDDISAKLLLEYAGYDVNLILKRSQITKENKSISKTDENIKDDANVEAVENDDQTINQFLKYNQHLIGVDQYIEQISDFLNKASQPVLFTARIHQFLVITGLGGSGKTVITATALVKYYDEKKLQDNTKLPNFRFLDCNNLNDYDMELKKIILGWENTNTEAKLKENSIALAQSRFKNVIVIIDNLPPDKYSDIVEIFDHTNATVILIMNGIPKLTNTIIPEIIKIEGLSDEDGAKYLNIQIRKKFSSAKSLRHEVSEEEAKNTIQYEYYKNFSHLVNGHPISLNLISNLINSRPKENISEILIDLQNGLKENNFIEKVYAQLYDRKMDLDELLDYTIRNSDLKIYFADELFCLCVKLLTMLHSPYIHKSLLKTTLGNFLKNTEKAEEYLAIMLQYGIIHTYADTETTLRNMLGVESEILFFHPIMRNAVSQFLNKTKIDQSNQNLFYESLVSTFNENLKKLADSGRWFASLQEKLDYLQYEYLHIEQALIALLQSDYPKKLDFILIASAYLCAYWEHHRSPSEVTFGNIEMFLLQNIDNFNILSNSNDDKTLKLAYIRLKLFLTDQIRRSFREDTTDMEDKYSAIRASIEENFESDERSYLIAHVNMRLGKLFRYAEQFEKAMLCFDSAIEKFKKYPEANKQYITYFEFTNEYLIVCYYYNGWLLEEFGKIQNAMNQYKNGIITARGPERFSAAACYLRMGYLNLLSGNMNNGAYYLQVCKTLDKNYAYGSAIVDIYQGFGYILSGKPAQGSLIIFQSFINLRVNFADGRSYLLSGYYLAIAVLHLVDLNTAEEITNILKNDFLDNTSTEMIVHAPKNLTQIVLNHIDATIRMIHFIRDFKKENGKNDPKDLIDTLEKYIAKCFHIEKDKINVKTLMEYNLNNNFSEKHQFDVDRDSFFNFKLILIFYWGLVHIMANADTPDLSEINPYTDILQQVLDTLKLLENRFDYDQLVHILNLFKQVKNPNIFSNNLGLRNPFNANKPIEDDISPFELFSRDNDNKYDITHKLQVDVELSVKQLLSLQDVHNNTSEISDKFQTILAHLLAEAAFEAFLIKARTNNSVPVTYEDSIFTALKSAMVGNIEYQIRYMAIKAIIILHQKMAKLKDKNSSETYVKYRNNGEMINIDGNLVELYQKQIDAILEFCKEDTSSKVLITYYKYKMGTENFDEGDLAKLKDIWFHQEIGVRRYFIDEMTKPEDKGAIFAENYQKIQNEIPEIELFQ